MKPQPVLAVMFSTPDHVVLSPASSGSAQSLTEQLAQFFREREGEWIDGRELGTVAGAYAWRSRCADLRKPPFSMRIENKQERIKTVKGTFVVSSYRYTR